MVRLSGGTYWRGSRFQETNERPTHKVMVSPFWLDRAEVTVGEYETCVAEGRCAPAQQFAGCNWKLRNLRRQHPMNCVTWSQARNYCRWAGKRLPTEAEWEYAARGGRLGREYPWGPSVPSCERAVMDDGGNGCGVHSTWPICSKPKGNSADGICDLAGNVWEWVSDRYGTYPRRSLRDPGGPAAGAFRIIRGGSYFSAEEGFLRGARRVPTSPVSASDEIGFRCAVSPNPVRRGQ